MKQKNRSTNFSIIVGTYTVNVHICMYLHRRKSLHSKYIGLKEEQPMCEFMVKETHKKRKEKDRIICERIK